ncbi:jg22908, partial [Pararge aegeria aegeria]
SFVNERLHEAKKSQKTLLLKPVSQDLQYPCSMLETMRRCWSGAPEWRPSAAALVAVCAAPEFLSLRDAAAARPSQAAAGSPLRRLADEGADGWEIWYGGAEPERAHTLVTTPTTFTHHHTLRVPPDNSEPVIVTAMCRVGTNMWLADSVGRLFVYTIATCALSWSVRLHEAVGGTPSAVAALHHLAPLPRLAIALACGRLFIVTSEKPAAEGTFVLTELGTATELCCLAAVDTINGIEVWAGGDRLYTYTVAEEGVSAAESLPTPAPGKLALLAAATNVPVVLGSCSPGVFVYAWCAQTRRATARLDCSKLAPCSESLQSIALDEKLNEERCRVFMIASTSYTDHVKILN